MNDMGKLLFLFDGRIGRQQFWIGFLVLLVVGIVTGFIPIIGSFIGAVCVYCQVCIRAKRLHDMGRTGWLQLIPILSYTAMAMVVISIGLTVGIGARLAEGLWPPLAVGGVLTALFAVLIAGLVDLGFLLWIGISGSDPYDNQYGPFGETEADTAPALSYRTAKD